MPRVHLSVSAKNGLRMPVLTDSFYLCGCATEARCDHRGQASSSSYSQTVLKKGVGCVSYPINGQKLRQIFPKMFLNKNQNFSKINTNLELNSILKYSIVVYRLVRIQRDLKLSFETSKILLPYF